jgi:hypothetical protein
LLPAVLVSGLLLPAVAFAAGPKTLVLVPDPSCRTNRLITLAEEGLGSLNLEGVKLVKGAEGQAPALTLQYFLLVREDRSSLTVQLDGRIFENATGKLLAEGMGASDSFSNDEAGRQGAARQAGQRLAEAVAAPLQQALQAKGKGRRVVVQATLDEGLLPEKDQILGQLKQAFRGMSPRLKGSTGRTLVLVVQTTDSAKSLASILEKGLGAKISWTVQSETSLIFRLSSKSK